MPLQEPGRGRPRQDSLIIKGVAGGTLGMVSTVAAAGVVLLAVGFLGLGKLEVETPVFWLVISSSVFLWILADFGLRAQETRDSPSRSTQRSLGPANVLTLFRALLAAMMVGCVALPPEGTVTTWLPGSLYFLVVLGDGLDGPLARRTGTVTALGAELDIATDRMAFLGAVVVAVVWERLHPGFLVVGILPLLFVAHMQLRRRAGLPVQALAPNGFRQTMGTLFTLFLALALLPVPSSSHLAMPGLALSVLLVLGFVRDWWWSTRKVERP